MRFDILTLFPESILPYLEASILDKAAQKNLVEYYVHNFRDYSKDKHQKVDDTPYGGGAGMVLTPQPIYDCIQAVKLQNPGARVVFMSPRGKTLTQNKLHSLKAESGLIIIAGRYEGLDQRIIDLCVDEEISLGDFVLCGGELPALCLVEGITRLLPRVLGNANSPIFESFSPEFTGKKKHPIYTKPEEFQGLKVPEVLLSGHHQNIQKWQTKHLKD